MTGPGPITQSAEFVEGRFRLVTQPAGTAAQGVVVFVHAFAEEMNKMRRMVARTARLLAAHGWRVVQRDLHGCGDSLGEFGDATWADWQRDVADEVAMAPHDQPLWLWGARAGALLLPTALCARPDAHLLLWQPAASGAQHLQQFLRLHAGARIVGSAKPLDGPTPAQRLQAGEAVEVGGYGLHPALAAGLQAARLEPPAGWRGQVAWLEVAATDPPALSPVATATLERWRAAHGTAAHTQVLRGAPFWSTQEIEDVAGLPEATAALVDAAMQAPHATGAAHARQAG